MTMRSRAKRPVEKGSHSNSREGLMWKGMSMLKMVCSFGWFGWMLKMVWFWCHLSRMHCKTLMMYNRKDKRNKLEEDRKIHHCWKYFNILCIDDVLAERLRDNS